MSGQGCRGHELMMMLMPMKMAPIRPAFQRRYRSARVSVLLLRLLLTVLLATVPERPTDAGRAAGQCQLLKYHIQPLTLTGQLSVPATATPGRACRCEPWIREQDTAAGAAARLDGAARMVGAGRLR